MKPRTMATAVTLAFAAIAVMAVVFALHGASAPRPEGDLPTPESPTTAAAATSTPAPEAGAETERAAAGDTNGAASTAGAAHSIPQGSRWAVVVVIDRETGQPVPGAVVHWWNSASYDALEADRTVTSEDRILLRHNTVRLAQRFGWQTATDAQGKAKVTRDGVGVIAATHGDRHGERIVQESDLQPNDGFVIELVPDRGILVRVVDDLGEPVPDVLVGLSRHVPGRRLDRAMWTAWARSQAPDGIAVLEHVRTEEDDSNALDEGETWRVFPILPGLEEDPGVAVSLATPPVEPIELRLPPCGRVVIASEANGQRMPFRRASLGPGSTAVATLSRQADADGRARFDRVVLHRRYRATADGNGIEHTVFDGPVVRDQEVTVTLGPVRDQVLLRGRLLLAPGEPLRDQRVVCHAQGEKRRNTQSLHTDGDGRFFVAIGEQGDHPLERLAFDHEPQGGRVCRAETVMPPQLAGIHDLGDLLLTTDRLVCAGRFLVDGRIDEPIDFRVECLVTRPDIDEPFWLEQPCLLYHQDDTGAFRVLGTTSGGPCRLNFAADHLLPREPVPFALGAEHLEIRLETGHRLAATLLLPQHAPEESLVAVLVPDEQRPTVAAADPEREHERLRAEPDLAATGGPYTLDWSGVPAGTYTLELHKWSSTTPLLRIPGVTVPASDPPDPRLEDIDLRPLVRLLQLRVLDESGRLFAHAQGFVFRADQPSNAPWDAFPFQEPETWLLVGKGPVELLVAIDDHRPTRHRAAGDVLEVRADPWPLLAVTIKDIPRLPWNVNVWAYAEPVEPRLLTIRSQSGSLDEEDGIFDVRPQEHRVVDGKVSLPIGDGPHALVIGLRSKHRITIVTDVAPGQLLATMGSVVASAPAEQWQAALDLLRQLLASDEAKAAARDKNK